MVRIMRNYIRELNRLGYNLKDLATESGFSQAKLSRIKTGAIPFTSKSADYEKIRNLSRRLSYREARKTGLTSKLAGASRRTYSSPEAAIRYFETVKKVKSKQDTTRWQCCIVGEFYNAKEKLTKDQDGYSHAYPTKTAKSETGYTSMQEEAIADAIVTLGGTNWKLKRLKSVEWREYILA